MTKNKEPEELNEIPIFWAEEEKTRQSKYGPRVNTPITNSLDTNKQSINHMGELFLSKYTVTKDARKGAYIYNGRYWQDVSVDYLQSLAMNCDSYTHTTEGRRKSTVAYALDRSCQLKIDWNLIPNEEIAFYDCVYNIVTDTKRHHQWEDYLNNVTPHKYQHWMKCPLWMKCLDDWFETEDKKLAFQEFFGYLLCSHAKYKTAMLLLGESDAGKSVPCEIAKHMVGVEFTCCVKPEDMNDPKLTAPLKEKKLNLVTELSSASQLSDGGFKQIISGEGIQVDKKFVLVETIIPTAKHIFATNVLPEIRDMSNGVYNRLMIIRFNKIVDKSKQDPDLQEKLKKEIEGIIVWAVEGLKRLVTNNGKFTVVAESKKLLIEYKISQNPILNFIETSDEVEKDPEGMVPLDQFRARFEKFKGGREWTQPAVGRAMKSLGYESISKNSKRYYKGLKFKEHRNIATNEVPPDTLFSESEKAPDVEWV